MIFPSDFIDFRITEVGAPPLPYADGWRIICSILVDRPDRLLWGRLKPQPEDATDAE